MTMHPLILVVLVAILLVGMIYGKDIPHHPVNISRGLTFEIPANKRDKFYLTGLDKKYTYDDIVKNKLIHDDVDSTQVLVNDDLISDSGIGYTDESTGYTPDIESNGELRHPTIMLTISGNVRPDKVKGFMKRF